MGRCQPGHARAAAMVERLGSGLTMASHASRVMLRFRMAPLGSHRQRSIRLQSERHHVLPCAGAEFSPK